MNSTIVPSHRWTRRRVLAASASLLALLGAPRVWASLGPPGLAVLYFDYTGTDAELGVLRKGLAQMLTSHLRPHASAYTLVERERLQDLFDELELAADARVDASTAARLGHLLGARYLVLGSFFDLMGTLRIDARLVEVETGRVLGSVGRDGPMDDFFAIEAALVTDLAALLQTPFSDGATPSAQPPPVPAAAPASPRRKVQTATIVTYSKALDAKDQGDVAGATQALQQVVEEAPDFELAVLDLDSLIQ